MTTKTKVQQTFDVEKGDTYSHALLILEKAGVITESRFRALLGVEDEEFIAALKHVDEFKRMCRGRYNTDKHEWCTCKPGELCQIRLTEILGHKSKANVYLFSLHAQLLDQYNVIHMRKANAPPGKPSKFYRLDEEWESNFMAMLKALVSQEEARIMKKFGYDLDNTEGGGYD